MKKIMFALLAFLSLTLSSCVSNYERVCSTVDKNFSDFKKSETNTEIQYISKNENIYDPRIMLLVSTFDKKLTRDTKEHSHKRFPLFKNATISSWNNGLVYVLENKNEPNKDDALSTWFYCIAITKQ